MRYTRMFHGARSIPMVTYSSGTVPPALIVWRSRVHWTLQDLTGRHVAYTWGSLLSSITVDIMKMRHSQHVVYYSWPLCFFVRVLFPRRVNCRHCFEEEATERWETRKTRKTAFYGRRADWLPRGLGSAHSPLKKEFASYVCFRFMLPWRQHMK